MKKKTIEVAEQTFQIEADCLQKAFAHMDEDAFSTTVELLAAAARIATGGCGHTGIACQHFAHLMCCIERPARFLSPSEAVHGGMGFLQKGDVLLLASRAGETAELLPMQRIAREKNVSIVAVTENTSSTLAKDADVVLPMYITRETDRYNAQGTTSFTMLNVLFDALQAALIEEMGYQQEQFAHIHPGGAVGKRLNKS